MKAIIIAAMVTALTSTVANADSVTTACHGNKYGISCTTRDNVAPPPITYTAEEIAAIKARDDAWRAYCNPHDAVGRDGLLRAVYAHVDCDIGRSRE